MAEKDRSRRVEPREIRRISTGGGTSYGLPPDLMETAVKRLGFMGLMIALMAPSAYLVERFTQPGRLAHEGGVPFPQIVAAILFAAPRSAYPWCPARGSKALTTKDTEDHGGNPRLIKVLLFDALH